MTDNVLVRGTTPSLIVDFSGITDFTVNEITAAAYFAFEHFYTSYLLYGHSNTFIPLRSFYRHYQSCQIL